MPYYESVFIARQDVSATQVEALSDGFATIIDEHGGKITKRETWGLKSLAYKIKKNRKGHYVLFNIDSPAEAVFEMERQMRLNEDVLRYLTIRVDELEESPSIQMQGKQARDDRARRRGGERGGREARPDEGEAEATSAKDGGSEDAPAEKAEAAKDGGSEDAPAEKAEAAPETAEEGDES